jgi:hypothetical protein
MFVISASWQGVCPRTLGFTLAFVYDSLLFDQNSPCRPVHSSTTGHAADYTTGHGFHKGVQSFSSSSSACQTRPRSMQPIALIAGEPMCIWQKRLCKVEKSSPKRTKMCSKGGAGNHHEVHRSQESTALASFHCPFVSTTTTASFLPPPCLTPVLPVCCLLPRTAPHLLYKIIASFRPEVGLKPYPP